jgi:hypothetical protein
MNLLLIFCSYSAYRQAKPYFGLRGLLSESCEAWTDICSCNIRIYHILVAHAERSLQGCIHGGLWQQAPQAKMEMAE